MSSFIRKDQCQNRGIHEIRENLPFQQIHVEYNMKMTKT